MKFLKQFIIILVISLCGELCNIFLPLPVPASIYGMVLLFVGLVTGVIPLSSVKEVSGFLIEIMAVMFVPAGVGLMASWGVLRPSLVPISFITVITIIVVMGVTGRTAQFIIKKENKKNKEQRKEKKQQGGSLS